MVCDRTFDEVEEMDEAGSSVDGAVWASVKAFLRAKRCTDGIRRRAHAARLIIVEWRIVAWKLEDGHNHGLPEITGPNNAFAARRFLHCTCLPNPDNILIQALAISTLL